jgi:hypothetical protein
MAGSSTAELRLRPTREALLRDALYQQGRFESLLVMSILRPERSG